MKNGFDTVEMVDKLATKRQSWQDLYPSERAIFEWLAMRDVGSVLDVGCAVGGFSALFPFSRYTGVDASPTMINRARELHPDRRFLSAMPKETFDLVMALGVLHLIVGDWKELLTKMWERAGKWLVFDLRLDRESREGEHEGMPGTPYRTVNYAYAFETLQAFMPRDIRMCSYRYPSNRTDHREVTMAAFLLERP